MNMPRYPVYIPTKGRADKPLTIRMFEKAKVPFRVVIEPSQQEAYAEWKDSFLLLPENNRGLVYARNYVKEYSKAQGEARHWQFDDDIRQMRRVVSGHRLPCDAGAALSAAEDFVDRYENVALCSFNSTFFVPVTKGHRYFSVAPFLLNARCYTCFLVLNSTPNRWRYRYNEDTDMSLQILADGWCTVLFNAFMIETMDTAANATGRGGVGGGQAMVYAGDGRLKMARDLERVWPGVVTTKRRFNRPQHHVAGHWTMFDNKLKRRTDVDWSAIEAKGNDERGMRVKGAEGSAIVDRIAKRQAVLKGEATDRYGETKGEGDASEG
jgi:hypothetical protein